MRVLGEDREIYVSRLKCWEMPGKWVEKLHAGAGLGDSALSPLYRERESRELGLRPWDAMRVESQLADGVPERSWAGIIKE